MRRFSLVGARRFVRSMVCFPFTYIVESRGGEASQKIANLQFYTPITTIP